MQNLGTILRTERLKSQLPLRQVARTLQIDTGLISKIERNERNATKEQISMFAKLYDLDQDTLFIEWYSDKIIRELKEASFKNEVLEAVHQKINS